MFIRAKRFRNKQYYYVVKAFKDDKKPKQKVVKYIGKIENLLEKLKIAENCTKNHKKH